MKFSCNFVKLELNSDKCKTIPYDIIQNVVAHFRVSFNIFEGCFALQIAIIVCRGACDIFKMLLCQMSFCIVECRIALLTVANNKNIDTTLYNVNWQNTKTKPSTSSIIIITNTRMFRWHEVIKLISFLFWHIPDNINILKSICFLPVFTYWICCFSTLSVSLHYNFLLYKNKCFCLFSRHESGSPFRASYFQMINFMSDLWR